MKKTFIVCISIFLCFVSLLAQEKDYRWVKLNTGYTNDFQDVNFITKDIGFVTGGWPRALLKTTDGGKTWNKQNVIDVLLTCTEFFDEKEGIAIGNGGLIYKTKNCGESWQIVESNVMCDLYSITINGDKVFVAGRETSIISTNRGETWKEISGKLSGDWTVTVIFLNDKIGYASGQSTGIKKTTDGGDTWNDIVSSKNSVLKMYPKDELNFWALWLDSPPAYSTDGGVNWVNDESGNFKSKTFLDYESSELLSVLVGKAGAIMMSTDKGKSWSDETIKDTKQFTSVSVVGKTVWTVGFDGLFYKYCNDSNISGVPVLIKPTPNQPGVDLPTEFVWKSAKNAKSYNLTISKNKDLSNSFFNDNTVDTTIIVKNLENFTVYYWSVTAQNDTDVSEPSEIRMFRTSVTSVSKIENEEIKISIDLSKDEITIYWNTIQSLDVSIYNILGNLEITKKINSTDKIDISFLNSGNYFIVLKNKIVSCVKKISIVR